MGNKKPAGAGSLGDADCSQSPSFDMHIVNEKIAAVVVEVKPLNHN